ncbi:MAG: succinate dehydrogenase, hydrophobic membrane anchor protein [Pseudomonadota bacterium]
MSTQELRTPTKITRGLGAAKEGTNHFIQQRVSAIALVFLVPWFILTGIFAARSGYDSLVGWIGTPWNAALLIVTFGAAFYHMRLGMQTVIEDYIGKVGMKQFLLIANTFLSLGLFVVAAMSIISVWLG